MTFNNSTESKAIGTGFGMPIVKKLTDLMGGAITVQSKLGGGTAFTVAMDMHIVDDPERYIKEEQRPKTGEAFSLDGRRILLAEDNALSAEIATAVL